MGRGSRGHRSLPHTADVIIEAWGPDVTACCEEGRRGIGETCARPGAAAIVAERAVHVPPGPVDDMLLDLLEEVVFALDVAEGIPIRARLLTSGHGGPEARLALADPAGVEPAGPFPRPSPGPASR